MIYHRKIYKENFGEILEGYEIHHKDGNHANNHPNNLQAVTLQEHYDIHKAQGDRGACHAIAIRMKLSHSEMSKLATQSNLEKVRKGTHQFLGGAIQRKRVQNKTHNFLGGKIQGENSRKQVKEGTFHLLGPEQNLKRIKNGTHNCLEIHTCPKCGKIGKGHVMFRHHFERCKW